jgi:hypothetical protein
MKLPRIKCGTASLAALLGALLLLAISFTSCDRYGSGASTARNTLASVRLELEKAPALNEPVKVTVTVTANKPINGEIEAFLDLPSPAVFINGQTWWRGALAQGQTHKFFATIAFVAEGQSSLAAIARFPYPGTIYGIDSASWGEWLLVTKIGGQLRPRWTSDVPSYSSPDDGLVDGSTLVNTGDTPRLLVVGEREGLEELRRASLVPAELRGKWVGRFVGDRVSVFDDPHFANGAKVVLYDRKRPTTGYHMAVLRMWTGKAGVDMAGGVQVPGRPVVTLDIIATAPQPGWPVEHRDVSPYEVLSVSYSLFGQDGTLDLVVRVNGQIVSRYTLTRGEGTPLLRELQLPSLEGVLP